MRILFDILFYLLEWQKNKNVKYVIFVLFIYFGLDMNEREKKKLASAGKLSTQE